MESNGFSKGHTTKNGSDGGLMIINHDHSLKYKNNNTNSNGLTYEKQKNVVKTTIGFF